VQSNDFVADDVVAWRKVLGECSGNFEVVLDERVGYPDVGADDGGLRDLGPAEGAGREGCAVTWSYVSCFVFIDIGGEGDVPLQGAM
jgi:hypothetical protein